MNKQNLLLKKKLQQQSNKGLNRYMKKSSTKSPIQQYPKYSLDTQNIYYQDRDSLRQLKSTYKKLWICVPLWVFITFMYFTISSIKQYQGKCPINAICGVYVRCHPGYELVDQVKCQIKASIVQQIQNFCKFQITQLQYLYGDQDCAQNQQDKLNQVYKSINQLTVAIKDSLNEKLSHQTQMKIKYFLLNQTNHDKYDFFSKGDIIIPTKKLYRYSCRLKLLVSHPKFYFYLIFISLIVIMSLIVLKKLLKNNLAKNIYKYLKQKTKQQKKLNVTLLGDQMNSIFGKIDQNMWKKINQYRIKDQSITIYQMQQYLYWQFL